MNHNDFTRRLSASQIIADICLKAQATHSVLLLNKQLLSLCGRRWLPCLNHRQFSLGSKWQSVMVCANTSIFWGRSLTMRYERWMRTRLGWLGWQCLDSMSGSVVAWKASPRSPPSSWANAAGWHSYSYPWHGLSLLSSSIVAQAPFHWGWVGMIDYWIKCLVLNFQIWTFFRLSVFKALAGSVKRCFVGRNTNNSHVSQS